MTHSRKNKGVCSNTTAVSIENGLITNINVTGGCNGNINGISALLIGQPAQQAAERLAGITCGKRSTSCPDQIALCLYEALEKQKL